MPRRVLYSFHFANDAWRAAQVRRIGSIEGNRPVTDNEWEAVKKGGDKAIQKWIDSQLEGKSATVVLVGAETAGRKWIDYEVEQSWNSKKGLVGIRIHRLKNSAGVTSLPGTNPFSKFTMKRDKQSLANLVRLYDPPGNDSKTVYANIEEIIEDLVEEAIETRNSY